jgi:F0F1-type ATP synthase assembly protein I
MKQVGPHLNLGMELFAAVAGFGLVGWFIDSKFGTAPVWMTVLLLLGAVGGMYNLIRTALKAAPPKPIKHKVDVDAQIRKEAEENKRDMDE